MTTSKFNTFMEMVNSIETRKRTTKDKAQELEGLLAEANNEYDIAELTGEPTKALTTTIEQLKTELSAVQRKNQSYGSSSIDNILKSSETNVTLANEILKDNLDTIKQLQEKYNSQSEELKTIRNDFLDKIQKIGMITKEATSLQSECNLIKRYIPGKENIFQGGVIDGINDRTGEGIIYITKAMSEQAYFKG